MGEAQSTNLAPQNKGNVQNSNSFLLKIEKVSEMYSEQWGNFNLYQQKEKPYDYIMQYVQSQIDQTYLKKKHSFYQSLIEPKNKNIVPVAFTEININKGLCNTVFQLSIYCQYFNFTLENAIKLKLKQRQEFNLPDILYILRCLVLIGKFCQEQRKSCSYLGIFKAKNIFVTPQGHLRIYPFSQNLSQIFINHDDEDQSSAFYKFTVKQEKIPNVQISKHMTPPTKQQLSNGRASNNYIQNIMSRKGLKLMNSKQQFLSRTSQNGFNLNDFDIKRKMSSQQSQSNYSSRGISLKRQDVKDFFDLGILLLQLFLLNETQYYYINQISKNYDKIHFDTNDKSQFQKRYNMDRIHFSLQKQLLYKKVPKKISNLIGKMILSPETLTYQAIQKSIKQIQQSGNTPSFCLRFQIEANELKSSKISSHFDQKMQKKSQKSFNVIEQPESIYLQQIEDVQTIIQRKMTSSNVNMRNKSPFKSSKQKKSVMLQNQLSKQSLISNMKIDNFLIPRKIRSISTQVSKNCSQKQL